MFFTFFGHAFIFSPLKSTNERNGQFRQFFIFKKIELTSVDMISCKVRRRWFRRLSWGLRTATVAVRCLSSSSTAVRRPPPPLSSRSTVTCRAPGSSSPASTASAPRNSLKTFSAGALFCVNFRPIALCRATLSVERRGALLPRPSYRQTPAYTP